MMGAQEAPEGGAQLVRRGRRGDAEDGAGLHEIHDRQPRARQVMVMPERSSSGSGNCGFMSVRVSTSTWLTAQFRYHLWSAGMTYQGASEVDVFVIASSKAAW